jgi:SPP1 family predicted phage head-tail adaptor
MRAGPLRHHCTIQRAETITRPGGGRVELWTDIIKIWAEITLPSGRVAVAADQLTAEITAEIRIRYRTDISAGMRIIHKSTTYKVEAALADNDQTMLRLLCSNVVNP